MTFSVSDRRTKAGNDLFKGMTKKKPADRKQDKSPPIHVGEHSRYQIKSGLLAGKFVARAFPKPPTKARGLIAEATADTEEAAIAALHDVIDAREDRRTDERRKDESSGAVVPSTEEYVEAICQVALSGPQRALLMALSLAGEDGLSGQRMASAAGYKSRASANRAFAGAGQLIADYLSVKARLPDTSDDREGTSLLGYRGAPQDETEPGNWILHAELRDAIRIAL